MKKSENYQLNLPERSDAYDVDHMNANTAIIDKELKKNAEHIANKNNPHGVTKTQVGLGNVDNTSDANKPVSTAQATAIADAKKAGTDAQSSINNHANNKSNPHGVTKTQIGLGNVDNTRDADKSVKHATTADSSTKATRDGNDNVIADTYLTKTGNSQNNTISFTNGDSTNPASWTDVPVITSGEKHSALFNKISTMFKNVRYLFKMLGTTDISKIGGGTLTGATTTLKDLASKLWIIPSSMNITIFDIGEPDSTKYPPSDEKEIPQPVRDIYLDVASGKVYEPIEDFEFGIIWYSYKTLKSVSNSILSTVSECTASTTETDIAGASAVAEINDSLTNILPNPNRIYREVTFDVNGHASLHLPDFISGPILFVYDVHGVGNLADINFAVTNGGSTSYGLYLMSPNAVGVFTVEIIYQPL